MPESSTIRDPARVRALAHPVRLALLDLLSDTDTATATECAARLGESVATCSFHLRMLAKYGFVEPAARRGREKPWRTLQRSLDVRPDVDQPGSVTAVMALATLHVDSAAARTRRYLAQAGREPAAWLDAPLVQSSSFWATAQEMAEVSAELQQITARFAGRMGDPGKRPPGSRPGRLFAALHPDVDAEGNDDD